MGQAMANASAIEGSAEGAANSSEQSENLIGIDEVQRSLNRSRASVYRYTNTDPRNLNPPFNPRKLNPEYRSDQKEPLMFHPNDCLLYTSPSPRDKRQSRMPSSA